MTLSNITSTQTTGLRLSREDNQLLHDLEDSQGFRLLEYKFALKQIPKKPAGVPFFIYLALS
jgi:hypothetical protein